jgi:hypothetical protein
MAVGFVMVVFYPGPGESSTISEDWQDPLFTKIGVYGIKNIFQENFRKDIQCEPE